MIKLILISFILLVSSLENRMIFPAIQTQTSKQGQTNDSTSQGVNQILEQTKALQNENKHEEALEILNTGLEKFPASAKILNEALQIYIALDRQEDALRLLDDHINAFPEKTQKKIRFAKQEILQPLIDSLLMEGKPENAFSYFKQLADAGYQRSHHLKHKDIYEPLRQHAGFEAVIEKISQNAGVGQPPQDFTVTLTSGSTFTLSEQKGKVILLDFWSTSCPPCIEEIPNIRTIYQKNKENGFDIISISLDENKQKLADFLSKQPMPWNTVFSGNGWDDDIAKLYEISSIPSVYLLDKKGILRYFDVRGNDLKTAVEKLLME